MDEDTYDALMDTIQAALAESEKPEPVAEMLVAGLLAAVEIMVLIAEQEECNT